MASENILLTFGQGVKSPLGELRTVPRKVTSLIAAISNAPGHEAWWSAHVWAENYRTQGNWLRCGAVVIDVDHHAGLDTKGRPLKHSPAPDAAALALLGAAAGPWAERWSFIHTTPRGARIGWLLADDLIDARPRLDRKEMEIKADRAGALRAHIAGVALARAMVTGLIADGWSGVYIVDEKASLDMARLYWAPYSQGRTPLLGVHAGREALWTLDEMEGLGSSLGAFRDPGRDGGRRLSPMELESQALAKIALSENGTELELAEALEKRPAEGPGDGSLELIQCARFAIGLGVADAATFVRVAESWNTKRSTPWSEGDLATRFEDALARWMGEGLAVGVPAGRYTRPGLTKVLREDRSFKGTLSFDNLSQVTLWREPRETGVAEDQKLTEELLVHAEGTICSRYGWPVIPKDALWSGLAAEAKVRAWMR